ncbi:MAG: MarR family winged helix-turn-helix transcriptional regulator [Thalassospira sp.]|uniref:MarR family winged helix-turn-helix transcriptional regulator n=1 Tax=Thalassospira sp. TaxID=1912094 RepID=UPI003A8A83D3
MKPETLALMSEQKTFMNIRLTYRLELLAQRAIAENDEIFLRETGCRIRELRVLRLIDDMPGTTFAKIAKETGLEKSLTSRIIQNLIAKDLVSRENSDADARIFRLSTTQKGKDVRSQARIISDELDQILHSPLNKIEMEQLDNLLEKLGEWVASDTYRTRLSEF